VAERLIPRLLRGTYRIIPFLGIPLSASINIASTLTVGNQARKYFSIWSDSEEFPPETFEFMRQKATAGETEEVKDQGQESGVKGQETEEPGRGPKDGSQGAEVKGQVKRKTRRKRQDNGQESEV
jgi:hypothetical protein